MTEGDKGVAEIEEKLIKMEKDIEFLKQVVDDINAKIDNITTNMVERNKHNAKMDVLIENVQKLLDDVSEKLDRISEKVNEHDKEIMEMKQEVSSHKERLDRHEKIIYTMATATVALTATLTVWIIKIIIGF